MFNLIQKFLFKFDPEVAHQKALALLKLWGKLPTRKIPATNPIELLGLHFPNRVGLAAGFDKDGAAIDGLARLGFGHIEIGTLTPKPQVGNPKPRLFRLSKYQAIINRMGFNNCGVEQAIENIKRARYKGILGINIGKNASTPIENAADDYLYGVKKVYPYASYITINISSPNTQNLRSLQLGDSLSELLNKLKVAQLALAEQYKKYVPLAVKIAPDLTDAEIIHITEVIAREKIDAVIATNTTQARELIAADPLAKEAGGLSGAPLTQLSTQVIKILAQNLPKTIPIIAAGGIMSAQDALEKLAAGASLVQIYTGFIYRGQQLINEIIQSSGIVK